MKDKLTTAFLIAPVLVLMLVLCLGSLVADAQQPTPPRVGWLAGGSPPAFEHLTEAFRQGMRERGYVDGQNFVLEIRAAEGRFDRLPGPAADLGPSKVAVILLGATATLQGAADRHRGRHRGPTVRGGQAGGIRGGIRRHGEGLRQRARGRR